MSSSDQQYPYDASYDPYADPHPGPYPAGGGRRDPQVTQTWEGQTWDTHHQPAVQGEQPAQGYQPHQRQPLQEQAYQQQAYQPYQTYEAVQTAPQHAAADTAYLPPQTYPPRAYGPEAYPAPAQPLPPEAPAPAVPAAPAEPVTPSPSFDAAGYSAPTTLGNARITDAQRARAEGRSPVIPPGIQPAGLTALLGLLLAGGAALGTYGLLLPLVLLQAVTAAGWFRLNGMWPARQGIALAFAGGLAADAALLVVGRAHATAAITGTLGVWVLLTLVLQLRSRADADERVYGLMATVASAALTILAAGHLAAETQAVAVGALAVAAAALARALPLPGVVSVVVSLLAAAGAGIAAGGLAGVGADGALLGLAAGGCALIGLRAASYDYPSRFVHFTAGVALPLTAAAPAVYVLGRALG